MCVRCSSILRQCASFSSEGIVIACVPGCLITASLPSGSEPKQQKTTTPARTAAGLMACAADRRAGVPAADQGRYTASNRASGAMRARLSVRWSPVSE